MAEAGFGVRYGGPRLSRSEDGAGVEESSPGELGWTCVARWSGTAGESPRGCPADRRRVSSETSWCLDRCLRDVYDDGGEPESGLR